MSALWKGWAVVHVLPRSKSTASGWLARTREQAILNFNGPHGDDRFAKAQRAGHVKCVRVELREVAK